jgi:hypothetical protein
MLRPKYEELEAILHDDRNWVAFLCDQATEFLDCIIVEFAEGVKVSDLLVVEECGHCTLSKGKDLLEHSDSILVNICVNIILAFIFVLVKEVSVIVVVVVVCPRQWGFEIIPRCGTGSTPNPGLP